MTKVMMVCGVQLDELMIGAINVGEEEQAGGVAAADVADICDRCCEFSAAIDLLLVGRLHILRTPAKVPDGRGNIGFWRLRRLVKQYPGLLCPDGFGAAVETCLLAVEFGGVEVDRGVRVRGVEMQMVKMGWSRRSRRRWRRGRLLNPGAHGRSE